MASVKVEIQGMDKYTTRLQKAGRHFDEIDVPLKRAGEMALAAVKSYPPYGSWYSGQVSSAPFRPGSNYRRTFDLQNAWQGRISHGGKNVSRYHITMRPGTRSRGYAPYVLTKQQSPVHRSWWIILDEWGPILEPFIRSIFEKWSKQFR